MAEYLPPPPAIPVHYLYCGPNTLLNNATFVVAGVSFRHEAIDKIYKNIPKNLIHNGCGAVVAQMVCDSDNPHDGGAIAVFLFEELVGYAPKQVLEMKAGSSDIGTIFRSNITILNQNGLPAIAAARLYAPSMTAKNYGIRVSTRGRIAPGFKPKPAAPPLGDPPKQQWH